MALADENMVMPVAPMYSGNGSGGFGGFGNDWGWIILLLLFAVGGWGNGFGGLAVELLQRMVQCSIHG